MNIKLGKVWYHGSDRDFSVLSEGSTITPWRELACAFAHKPTELSYGDDGTIVHNGTADGFLYIIDEALSIGVDIFPHPRSTMSENAEFLTARPLKLKRIESLPSGEKMEIIRLEPDNALRTALAGYAENCGWAAGPGMALFLREGRFTDWERPFLATENNVIAGYCSLTKTDYIPDVPYSPWVGFVFTDPLFRGARLSQRMISKALDYAAELGFETAYISTEEENLYEKYGFKKIDRRKTYGTDYVDILSIDIKDRKKD